MFEKILIANRGEFASRIIQTCKKRGIKSDAIYSVADEAYLVSGLQVKESYINIDKIIDIAKQSNVDAIHPGYGFMSENAHFVETCEREGIVFIGPKAKVMEQMGDKIEARQQMKAA